LGAGIALLALLALSGCATPVDLNPPAPVQQLNPPAPRVTVPPSTYAPVTPQPTSPQPPTSQAQPLAPAAPISVQPLGPTGVAPAASAPTAPQGSAYAPAAPAASAPAASALPQFPALPPGAVRFVCQDGSSFVATFGDVSVTLQTALGNLTLDQTVSADGARYRNSAFQVWFKGRQATVTNFLQNTTTVCQQQ
jgi:membrane-bound inhibitor of C-type lysozyme